MNDSNATVHLPIRNHATVDPAATGMVRFFWGLDKILRSIDDTGLIKTYNTVNVIGVEINMGLITSYTRQKEFVITDTRIRTASIIKVSLRMQATADHTLDEVVMDKIKLEAGNIIDATSFTIYAEYETGSGYGKYFIDYEILF